MGPDISISDQLREGLIQTIAQINLLLRGWFEPPRTNNLHLSTLIQQLLSLIAQYGGVSAIEAWGVLCQKGVFLGLTQKEFSELLHSLGRTDILVQENNGLLLLGPKGERIVNHFSFLAAFTSQEEFRVVHKSSMLGTLPLSRPLEPGSYIIFAGRRWQVVSCRQEDKVIEVNPSKGGKPPIFDGMGGKVHDRVRKEMRDILSRNIPFSFLDKVAAQQVEEARAVYSRLELNRNKFVLKGTNIIIFSWLGDWANDALALILRRHGLKAESEGLTIIIHDSNLDDVLRTFREIGLNPQPDPEQLAATVQNKLNDKWDYLLTEQLLSKTYASRELDLDLAIQFVKRVNKEG